MTEQPPSTPLLKSSGDFLIGAYLRRQHSRNKFPPHTKYYTLSHCTAVETPSLNFYLCATSIII